VPRNRDARIAVLGSSVQRTAAYGQSTARSRALKRRVVVVGLVVVSLALLTVSYRSAALNPLEGYGASALRPFEIAANRVARPFRDATSWVHGVFAAKSLNRALEAQNRALRQEVAYLSGTAATDAQLRKLINYHSSPRFPACCTEVGADVLTSPTPLAQSVTISAGSDQGIANQDVVVTNGGLVGTIGKVTPNEAQVILISNPGSDVRAVDEANPSAIGIIDHGVGTNSLIFDQIGTDLRVGTKDVIVTAGSPAGAAGLAWPSLFPPDIPIGYVSSVYQSDTDIYKEIQVQPFVDLSSLESVLVLVPKPTAHHARGR
jgi:rod shape-determining protein MreC